MTSHAQIAMIIKWTGIVTIVFGYRYLVHGNQVTDDDCFDMDRNHSLDDQGDISHRKLASIGLKRPKFF